MRLKCSDACDVLVLGSGIAGISAALEAAGAGRQVLLVCRGRLFSGSSFYPGTWGLGLIGPDGPGDEEDLVATIERVGCGMAESALVRSFVAGIEPAISKLRRMGVRLRRAERGNQREFVPCFDHKHRDWNGIEFESVREVFSRKFEELGVRVVPGVEALELIRRDGRVTGAVLASGAGLTYVSAGAVVLATGGYGSLFKYHLCTEDVEGVGQALALEAGCSLVNMEFMQMMPGYVTPAPHTIFNEKAFRFAKFTKPDGSPLLEGAPEHVAAVLDERSKHGPFTSRLSSREFDLTLFRQFAADERGVRVRYSDELRANPPEFVRTYFDWLREAKGLTMADPIWLGVFAHAANGGVRIDEHGFTGVPGLYAAGEVTGGMHGADRLGGLSTANGLVFGGRAGTAAAEACAGARPAPAACEFVPFGVGEREASRMLGELRDTMFRHAMVIRTDEGLSEALGTVRRLRAELDASRAQAGPNPDARAVARNRRLSSRLLTAEAVLLAARMRQESRGSHFRADYPAEDDAWVKRITVAIRADGGLAAKAS